VPPVSRAVKSGGLLHCWPTLTLLMVTVGFCFSNSATSAFQFASRSFWEPSGWQSTVMTVLPPASLPESSLPFVEHAAMLTPRPAATASAATRRYCGTDIYSSLREGSASSCFVEVTIQRQTMPRNKPTT
jgi:hypothetical protein